MDDDKGFQLEDYDIGGSIPQNVGDDFELDEDIFEDHDLGGGLDPVPARLEEYDPRDFMDPIFAMAIVSSLQHDAVVAGGRNFQVRKESQEALDYLLDMYPEYASLPKKPMEVIPGDDGIQDLTNLDDFATDSVAERTEWLKSLYQKWHDKRYKESVQVHVVANPAGDGFALDHVNPSLGFVNSDIYDADPSGIKSYATYADVLTAADQEGFDIVEILPEDRLTLEDVELLDNVPLAPEQIRSNFTDKSIEILDKKKKWPRLNSEQEITGWEAMEIANGQGYQPEFIGTGVAQTEYWMTTPFPGGEQRMRLRKAEYDYLKELRVKATIIPAIDLSSEQQSVLATGDTDQKAAVYKTIGQGVIETVVLNEHDALEAGKTYMLFKDGLIKENDYRQFSDNLIDRYKKSSTEQKANVNPLYAAFTTTGLAILNKHKRWPKLDKEQALSGWKAMELAHEKGFDAVSLTKDGAQTEYWLTHPDENIRDIRVKKTEFEYFNMVKHGEVAELTTDEDQEKNAKIQHLLSLTWPTPSEIILENELALTNTTSEVHRGILQESVAFLKENKTAADQQMQNKGYIDDQLATAFYSLPSALRFERTLRSKHMAKCYNGDVFSLSLDEKLCCTGSKYKKTGEVVDLEFGKETTLDQAIEQVREATYGKNPAKTADKNLYELNFKEYVQTTHKIDVDQPAQLSGVSGIEIYGMMQEWAEEISVEAINGGNVPEANLAAVRIIVEQEFVKLNPEQKNAIYSGIVPVEQPQEVRQNSQEVPFPFEMTKEEFRNYYEKNKDNLGLSVKTHVEAFYSTDEAQKEAKSGIEAGEYVSEADYIHKQSVKDCLDRHLIVEEKILADYPELTAPLPPVWSVTKKEFMNHMGSYRKAAECTDQEFLKLVIKDQYHKQEVQKALDAGFNVPEKVIDDYPSLEIDSMRMK